MLLLLGLSFYPQLHLCLMHFNWWNQQILVWKVSQECVTFLLQVGLRNHAIYCSTKGALDSLSRVMGLELGEYGIRVNCVNPTVVMTAMGRLGWQDSTKAKPMLDRIPLHRFAGKFKKYFQSSTENSVYVQGDNGVLNSIK